MGLGFGAVPARFAERVGTCRPIPSGAGGCRVPRGRGPDAPPAPRSVPVRHAGTRGAGPVAARARADGLGSAPCGRHRDVCRAVRLRQPGVRGAHGGRRGTRVAVVTNPDPGTGRRSARGQGRRPALHAAAPEEEPVTRGKHRAAPRARASTRAAASTHARRRVPQGMDPRRGAPRGTGPHRGAPRGTHPRHRAPVAPTRFRRRPRPGPGRGRGCAPVRRSGPEAVRRIGPGPRDGP